MANLVSPDAVGGRWESQFILIPPKGFCCGTKTPNDNCTWWQHPAFYCSSRCRCHARWIPDKSRVRKKARKKAGGRMEQEARRRFLLFPSTLLLRTELQFPIPCVWIMPSRRDVPFCASKSSEWMGYKMILMVRSNHLLSQCSPFCTGMIIWFPSRLHDNMLITGKLKIGNSHPVHLPILSDHRCRISSRLLLTRNPQPASRSPQPTSRGPRRSNAVQPPVGVKPLEGLDSPEKGLKMINSRLLCWLRLRG